jgi:uncharacterized membrane protein YhaH (DUF805 family)
MMGLSLIVNLGLSSYPNPNIATAIARLIVGIFVAYVNISLMIKRFHDSNKSGWNVFWGLVPIVGLIYVIVIGGFIPGTKGDNRYGSP